MSSITTFKNRDTLKNPPAIKIDPRSKPCPVKIYQVKLKSANWLKVRVKGINDIEKFKMQKQLKIKKLLN